MGTFFEMLLRLLTPRLLFPSTFRVNGFQIEPETRQLCSVRQDQISSLSPITVTPMTVRNSESDSLFKKSLFKFTVIRVVLIRVAQSH